MLRQEAQLARERLPVWPALYLLACLLIWLPAAPGFEPADGSGSLLKAVQALEMEVGITAYADRSLSRRIEDLELAVAGKIGSGPLLARLARIEEMVKASRHPAGSQSSDIQPSAELFPDGLSAGQTLDQPAPEPILPAVESHGPELVPVARLGSIAAGDYVGEVMKATKGRVFRFNEMPIPVYVTYYPDPDYLVSCMRGFQNWEEATGGVVRFARVADEGRARIKVIWKPLGMSKDSSGCTLGAHTTTKWRSRGSGSLALLGLAGVPVPIYIPRIGAKYSVQPQIIEVNLDLVNSKDRAVRYRMLENVVIHELGHALGLFGHSPVRSDIMYPVTDEHSRLSQRDINTLKRIYSQKADIPL